MAGSKWIRLFLRHTNLAIRLPERTSMQRAAGFNKAKVEICIFVLKKFLFSVDGIRAIPATNIHNVDESGFTVCQKHQHIIALLLANGNTAAIQTTYTLSRLRDKIM